MRFRLHPLAAAALALTTLPSFAQLAASTEVAATPSPDAAPPSTADVVLPQVKVVDHAPGEDYAPVTATVGKLPVAVRDIPQVVTVVTRAVLDAQNATSLTEALRNVPGITLQAGEGGAIGDNVNLRGFTARTDIYLDGSRDRGQYKRDTFSLDSVEVLKGPSSLFFGRGSTGGVINQVSKTPLKTDLNQVGFSYGTDDYTRTTADFNRVLSNTAAVRVALFAQDVKSTRDVVQQQDWGIAPSLRVALNKDTDLTLTGLYQQNRDVPDYGIPFVDGAPAEVPHDRFYGNTDDQFDQNTAVGKIKVEHRLNSWLTLQNQTQLGENSTGANPTPYRVCTTTFNNPAGSCPVAAPGAPYDQVTVQSDRRARELKDTSAFTQFDAIAKLNTGSISHIVVGGVEIGRDSTHNQAYTASRRQLDNLGNFEPNATPADIGRTRAATFTEGSARTMSVYLNDTVGLTPEWKVVGGIRRDRFDADVKTVNNSNGAIATQANGQPNAFARTDYGTSVRGGVIWQPTTRLSTYASYGTSFNPSAEAVTISASQSTVAPEKTKSYEVGAKWDVFNSKLSLTSAVFHIEKTNARTTDQLGVVTVDGRTQVEGFELGAVGRITRNWQVIAGYSRLESELKKTNDGTGTGAARVSFQGNELPNTPANAASLFTTYRMLRDYEVGGGFNYIDERFVTTSNLTKVDSYVRADVLAAYHQPRYDVQLNVQNLFDEEFFDSIVASENGRAVPGRGRTVILSGLLRWGKT
ncbi:MAG: TonB-dependent siderophore receptor [Pseudomonadota bacterium]